MLPFQLGRQTSGLRAAWLTWATTVITYKIRTLYLDNIVEYILFKKIFKFSANILLLNIKILFLREHLLFFLIYYCVKIDTTPLQFLPNHTLRNHDLNKLESTSPEDNSTQISAVFPNDFWEDFWRMPTIFNN